MTNGNFFALISPARVWTRLLMCKCEFFKLKIFLAIRNSLWTSPDNFYWIEAKFKPDSRLGAIEPSEIDSAPSCDAGSCFTKASIRWLRGDNPKETNWQDFATTHHPGRVCSRRFSFLPSSSTYITREDSLRWLLMEKMLRKVSWMFETIFFSVRSCAVRGAFCVPVFVVIPLS